MSIRITLLELIAVHNRERMVLRIALASATHKSVGSCRPLTRSVAGQWRRSDRSPAAQIFAGRSPGMTCSNLHLDMEAQLMMPGLRQQEALGQ